MACLYYKPQFMACQEKRGSFMDYIDRLKIARTRKNMRQADISYALGLKRATYGMYETRKNKMDVETFGEICRLLD
ncbi:MAG: helix-turn-helix transcriptional regulator, partial [Butyricicoccus sp.]